MGRLPTLESTVFLNGFPSLSFDDTSQEDDALYSSLMMDQISGMLRKFTKRFSSLKSKWRSAFSDVEANYLVMVKDLMDLQQLTNTIASTVGTPDSSPGAECHPLWDQFKVLRATTMDRFQIITQTVDKSTASLNTMVQDQTLLQSSMAVVEEAVNNTTASLQQQIHQVETTLQSFDSRFFRLLPVLKHLQASKSPSPPTDPTILNQIQDLQLQVRKLQDALWSQTLLPNLLQPPFLMLMPRELISRHNSSFYRSGLLGMAFKLEPMSFSLSKTFRPGSYLTSPFDVTVYSVSLLDFFNSIGHVEAEKTFSSFYNQYKTGFASMYEARVTASVQNLFPMVFGKSDASGLDASDSLPAVTNPEKWDNGATGLQYQISHGMGDVEYQLESTIDSILADYPDARQIARECLYKSKRFIMELYSFISQDYQKWKHWCHSNKEAWKMTTVCVRRIFEEIHSEHVIAKDVYDQSNKDFTTAHSLWATWKAHNVMAKYLKHQFYEHPSISAVLA